MKKKYFSLLLLLVLGVTNPAFGQGLNSSNTTSKGSGSSSLSLTISPKYPGPKENTTITVVSFQVNMDTTPISWYIDGEMKLTGTGKKTFSFVTKSVGRASVIKVVVESAKLGEIYKEINITPTDLDILWEADTYVPPFYKGKALPTSQSTVRVVPFPSFSGAEGYYNSKDLIYKWKKGYFGNAGDSGYGKNTFIYKTGYTFNSDEVQTTVSTTNGDVTVSKTTPIYVYDPKIVFFENKPMEGIRFEESLGNSYSFQNSEITIHAIPYYFSLKGLYDNSAAFTWKLDGKKLPINPDNKSEFTFRKPEKGSGGYQLKLDINNTEYELQTASKNLSLSYSNQ